MNRNSAPTKIALGQVFLLLGVLTCAKMVGFIPDQDERILAGRVAIGEAVAMNSAELVVQKKTKQLDSILARVVDRCPGMLSAGVRGRDGSLVAQVADHASRWRPQLDHRSKEVQMKVPIWIGQQRWGHVEFCFEPLAYTGKHAWLLNPWTLHTVFILAASYVVFSIYLGRQLEGLVSAEAESRDVSTGVTSQADGQQFDLSAALRQPAANGDKPVESRGPSHRSDAITSSLPADDPVFHDIVHGFVESLGEKILELHAACGRRDLEEVARLAHWIKGSCGTVGFSDFTYPAVKLQDVAQHGKLAEVEAVIAEIIQLYQRISVSAIGAAREDAHSLA